MSDIEINETISKCGINQEIIQKSCGDGKIESSTLYLLMGIFRRFSPTLHYWDKSRPFKWKSWWYATVESCWCRFFFAGWLRMLKWNNLTKIFHIFRWRKKPSDLWKKIEDNSCSFPSLFSQVILGITFLSKISIYRN